MYNLYESTLIELLIIVITLFIADISLRNTSNNFEICQNQINNKQGGKRKRSNK